MLLREAVSTAQRESERIEAWVRKDGDLRTFQAGYGEALLWFLGLLAECDDLELEELT